MSSEVCTDPACFLCEQNRLARLRAGLAVLARNLRDAAGCAMGFSSGVYSAASWLSGQLDGQAAWEPNCDGVALRGWKS